MKNRTLIRISSLALVLFSLAIFPAWSAPPEHVDLDMVTRIRQEEFNHSQVMEIASELTDRIGPRLTGSPNMKKANEWTRDKMAEWGLQNAHLESWGPFGRGWVNDDVDLRMVTPDVHPIIAFPQAWTPGTNGRQHARAILVKAENKEDLEQYKGKLAGAIVLLGAAPEVTPDSESQVERYTEAGLADLATYPVPEAGKDKWEQRRQRYRQLRAFREQVGKFLVEEKALAVLYPSRKDSAVFVQEGGSHKLAEKDQPVLPSLVLETEDYGRIARLLDRDVPVELELDVRNRFIEDDPMAYNTVAEIPGTDKADEVVMLGAHLDSWHAGTGATDNGAGSAVVMEVVRILKALGVQPRRTIRAALWSGEEQGLYGSRAYVRQHLAEPSEEPKDYYAWLRSEGPYTLKPEHEKLSAYFNLDNGTGKIRGIYAEESAAVVPIFEAWLRPFHDLGATTVTLRTTGGTDHIPFDKVGIPAFQFIQDAVEYDSRSHHSNIDTYERLQRQDLMQAAAVMAFFVYQAAMREEMLPRKPLPQSRRPEETKAAPARSGD